ncbi:hypothetical protein [Nocardia abscessus]|uniref:hypothetical protein n=1 Tax=Nocardia abscessus TaxID=120957 RepID=UPI00245883B6|nr:hypothetical protein [Nocardia abscessus]
MTTTYQIATTAKTQRYGHLELGFATQNTPVRGARVTTNPDLKDPVPMGSDWRSLGTVFCDRDDPILMVKDHSPQRDLLVAPARYDLVATVQVAVIGDAWKVWRPVPPTSDYVALGVYVTGPDVTPSTDAWCV